MIRLNCEKGQGWWISVYGWEALWNSFAGMVIDERGWFVADIGVVSFCVDEEVTGA